ncbi:MAG TPA: response regulator [Kiritimatiellia bacterium]|nr:response regulator [Kiritimatiellia bacterium]HMO99738.1 response regulator [Kiritimatiellia bacterium]HMP97531.1 response regulator [Kiritimatiellia bacterium]
MKRLMIVDDEESFTRLMALNVEDTGDYEVRIVNDASQATRVARLYRPDVVLLDILMPGKSGIKLAEEWQADPELSGIPLVFLTAAMSKEQPMVEGGVLDKFPVLVKPVSFLDILRQLEAVVSGR